MINFSVPALLLMVFMTTTSCSFSKDRSYTAAAYKKMGMPDHTMIWSKDEYGQALSILRNQKLYSSLTMPRKFSRKSGEIFRRLVSKENMSFMDDTSLSIRAKALNIQHFSSFQAGMIGLYTHNVKDLRYYRDELIDLYIFGLLVYNNMLDLSEKLSQSDDEIDIELSAANSFVIKGYVDLVITIAGEQLKSKVYRAKDLNRLTEALSESLTQNWKRLGPADKQKIIAGIQPVIDKSPSKNIKNAYRDILSLLHD